MWHWNRRMNKPRPTRSLGDLMQPALADALKAQGFAAADILGRWPEIAGERLAAQSMPVRIVWPPRPKAAPPDAPPDPATLVLKVESAFAFEVQMMQAQIIERVNAVFGWRCVGKLRLSQGPVARPNERRAPAKPVVAPDEARQIAETVAPIADEDLRDALQKLGTAVFADAARRRARR